MVNGMPAEPRDLADELGVSVQTARTLEHTDAALSACPVPAEAAGTDSPSNAIITDRATTLPAPAADGSRAELMDRVRAAIDRL